MTTLEFAAQGFATGFKPVEKIALPSATTIVDIILARGKAYPDRPAIVSADGVVKKYRDLATALPRNASYTFFTSGTTGGRTKIIQASDAQMGKRVARCDGVGAGSSLFSTSGSSSEMSKIFWMLLRGGTAFNVGASRDLDAWLAMCAAHDVEILHFMPKNPAALNLLSRPSDHKFKKIVVVGSVIEKDLVARLTDKFGGAVYINYSTTETGPIAGGFYKDFPDLPGCVGKVFEGLTVEIDAGRIRIKGDTVPAGYERQPGLTARYFRDGWFYPGDLGRIEGDLLFVTGRDPAL